MPDQTQEMLDNLHRIYRQVQLVQGDDKAVDVDRLAELANNWKDEQIPLLQRQVINAQLDNLRRGVIDPVFRALRRALGAVPLNSFSLLDIGCATGHYSEVIKAVDRRSIVYSGCDYSAAMIACARQYYPETSFAVQDITALTYPPRAFDVVLVSGVLQYVADYQAALAHVLRVAAGYAILHRLPVTTGKETTYREGAQYSIVTARACFSKRNIIREIADRGFMLVYETDVYGGDSLRARCRRVAQAILRGPRKRQSNETLVFRRRAD